MTFQPHVSQFAAQRAIHQIYEVERLEGDDWVSSGELVVAPGATSLEGQALGAVRYRDENHALMLYGHGRDNDFIGRLNFTDDGLAFTGTTQGADGETVVIRGVVRKVVYHTKRRIKKDPKAPLAAWDDLSIMTEWVDEHGVPVLEVTYKLGDQDISDRTRVTHVEREKGQTTLEMVPGFGPGQGDNSFIITLYSSSQTFDGTYTDDDGTEYAWQGAIGTTVARERLAAFRAAANVLGEVPPRAAVAASMSLQDLDNISSIQTVTNDKGDKIVIDWAQRQCGDYFNKCLINALDQKWIDGIYGHAYLLPPNVEAIFKANKSFFQGKSTLGTGQMLYDQFGSIDRYKHLLERIKPQAMKDSWNALGSDAKLGPEYQSVSNDLYIQGYRDGVPQIQAYLADKSRNWGKDYYEWLTSDANILTWQIQVASQQFENVKTRMYEWYTKLEVLSPGADYGKKFLTIAYSALIGVNYTKATWAEDIKPFLEAMIAAAIAGKVDPSIQTEAQRKAAEELQKALLLLVGTEQKVVQISDAIAAAMTTFANRNPGEALSKAAQNDEVSRLIGDELQGRDPNAYKAWGDLTKGGKAKGILQSLFYGAAAGFVIFQIVSSKDKPRTPRQVVQDVNLGMLSLALLTKGVQKMMSLGVGRFLEAWSQAQAGAFRTFAGELATWFKAGGKVTPTGALGKGFVAVFGENVSVFMARRLGPAMAVVGAVLSAFFLADAIKVGHVRDIVFEALNTFFALAGVVFIGLELMSFAWAGPVGLAVAAVGLIVVLVQFIWNLIDPSPPPPDPITEFVNGPMVNAGFATR